jgi:hypothetical protein
MRSASFISPAHSAAKKLKPGDNVLLDARTGYLLERLPKSEIEEFILEEIPDVTYETIGALSAQIEALRDAVELPHLYPEEYQHHKLSPPKGVLLYGPPGCGKTLLAKALANSLATRMGEKTGKETRSYFLNIKGPELLNKYVGETERLIRQIFRRARYPTTHPPSTQMHNPSLVFPHLTFARRLGRVMEVPIKRWTKQQQRRYTAHYRRNVVHLLQRERPAQGALMPVGQPFLQDGVAADSEAPYRLRHVCPATDIVPPQVAGLFAQ